jgi:hypothetical protein
MASDESALFRHDFIARVAKKAEVGSTGQRNIFNLRCSERTYDYTKRSPWLVTRAEG